MLSFDNGRIVLDSQVPCLVLINKGSVSCAFLDSCAVVTKRPVKAHGLPLDPLSIWLTTLIMTILFNIDYIECGFYQREIFFVWGEAGPRRIVAAMVPHHVRFKSIMFEVAA
jgi:hypothetical protein